MKRANGQQNTPELVSAAGIASFVYCPEQWRLQYGASRGQAWFLVFARRGMKNYVRCSRLGNGATRWG